MIHAGRSSGAATAARGEPGTRAGRPGYRRTRIRPERRGRAETGMDDLAFARALHVLAVVIWIGGVGMVTMVVLPAVRRGDLGPDRARAFAAIERRFSWHARVAILVVDLPVLYMIDRADLWDRFRSSEFWWMHAMVAIWLAFAVLSVRGRAAIPAPSVRALGDGSTGCGVRLGCNDCIGFFLYSASSPFLARSRAVTDGRSFNLPVRGGLEYERWQNWIFA